MITNEPDFDHMTPAQVDEYLKSCGYKPEKVREHGKIFMKVVLENIKLHQELDETRFALDNLKKAIHPLLEWLGYVWATHAGIGNLNMDLIPAVLRVLIIGANSPEDFIRRRFYQSCLDYYDTDLNKSFRDFTQESK